MTLDDYAKNVHAANKKWWQDINTGQSLNRNIGELLMLMVTELAEAMEGHRKSLQDDKLPQYQMLDVELVDCLIRIFDLAGQRRIPLQEIYDAKMKFNAQRADHKIENRLLPHGKKY